MVGAAVGLALTIVLIVVPRMVQGDYYEITDPLVFMGLPLLVVGAAVGATIGALTLSTAAEGASDGTHRPRVVRGAVVLAASAAAIAATWLFLWAVGAVDTAPLGVG